jgi:hypothetical protein
MRRHSLQRQHFEGQTVLVMVLLGAKPWQILKHGNLEALPFHTVLRFEAL